MLHRDHTLKTHTTLARQVLEQARVQRKQSGDHLPEQVFAALCGVSRTPLRSAYKILEDNGFVTRREDQGYFLSIDPDVDAAFAEQQLNAAQSSLAETILADRGARRLDDDLSVSFLIRRYGATRGAVLGAGDFLR